MNTPTSFARSSMRTGSVWLLAGALALALQACGGGGSDEPDTHSSTVVSLSGGYTVPFIKVQDTCNTAAQKSIFDTQSVSQSGATVSVRFSGLVATGPVDADGAGFVAKQTQKVNGVNVVTTLTYRATSSVNTYSASLNLFAKGNGKSCSLTYTGQAQRQ